MVSKDQSSARAETTSGDLRSKLGWYYHRLRSMSATEIAHRTHEQVKRTKWRWYSGGWDGFHAGDGTVGALPGFREALRTASPALRTEVTRTAHDIVHHPLEIFGQRWSSEPLPRALAADPLLFHLDPVSRQHWPENSYCFDIPYRSHAEHGDYKFCAEFNTLQICQTLAAANQWNEDREFEPLVWAIWDLWYETNPPFRGINWVSGVNIALRAVSLLITSALLDAPTKEARVRARAMLNASGYWLERYPSLHSSANNHLIAESVALYAIGTSTPDLPDSRRYARLGRKRIEREALRQVLPDGVGAEMSPSYAAFAIEWLLLAVVIANYVNQPFDHAILDRLAAAAEHFKWLMDSAGNVPSIGDNDNSCVIASGKHEEKRYVASMCAAIAGVTKRQNLSPVSHEPSLRDLVFQSPAIGSSLTDGIRHFRHGGLSVVRETHGSSQAVLVFDHGPLGYLQICAHGHADTLSIWLSIGDQSVLVDAGTYVYGGSTVWRDYFRATKAHNTVELSGTSSSTISGPFNWSQRARGRLVAVDDGASWSMTAHHDGYMAALGLTHVRRLQRTSSGFHIEDYLRGGSSPARIAFLVHPELETRVEGDCISIHRSGSPIATMTSLSRWRPKIARGIEVPATGWHSLRFGMKTPASQIVFSGTLTEVPVVTAIDLGPPADGDRG